MFLNPDLPISKHGWKLPHWQQGEALIFVTWRLADSIPQVKLAMWHAERSAWLTHHPPPWDDATEDEYHERFSRRLDEWLDAGEGSCILRDPSLAKIVADALKHFDDQRYRLDAFVVMPNHVHVIFQPLPSRGLAAVLHGWKGFTASEINRRTKHKGELWQADYWDRIIRNPAHWWKYREYICNNPIKARLREGDFVLWLREPEATSTEPGLSSPDSLN